MDTVLLIRTLASVVRGATPLIIAGIGETITEKAGVINLSLDGSILLSAMVAFGVAFTTGSVMLGFLAAMAVGALMALIIAFGSIALRQDQVAIGFVLTLLGAELSSFLGNPFVRQRGPSVPHLPIPFLADIPVVGPIFFSHNLIVYFGYVLIILSWLYIFKTQPGLRLQGVGERPEAAFARGSNVNLMRYVYTAIGGALVGMSGAAFSLSIKLGWSHGHTTGNGWIALALVIFGGWHPLRVAFGAYLFGGLKSLSSIFQRIAPGIPSQFFNGAPFALMILVLLLVSSGWLDRLLIYLPRRVRRVVQDALLGAPPGGLGRVFVQK
jgi:general nucleoside transport system permease protein